MSVVLLLARVSYSMIFILGGLNHLWNRERTIAEARAQGVPFARAATLVAGVALLAGGCSVLLGWHVRYGALLLVAFLLSAAVTMHAFWRRRDPEEIANQQAHFFKNLALAGGGVLLAYYGAGPFSIAP